MKKSVEDLLRDADPIRHEPSRTDDDRDAIRRAVLATAAQVPPTTARFAAVRAPLALVALVLVFIVVGARFWSRGGTDVMAAVRFEARLAEDAPGLGLRAVRIPANGRTIYLHPEPIVTNSDIAQARVVEGDGGRTFSVAITFTADGAAKMLRATQGHIDRPLAILFDGEVALAPTVRAPMSASAIISGDYTRSEVERIVSGIVGR
jgi:SecD-like export protein